MSRFMMIAGVILAAIGLALGLMVLFSPAKLMTYGIEPATAAILLTGGILAIGLGGVIDGLAGQSAAAGPLHYEEAPAPAPPPRVRDAVVAPAAAAETMTEAAKPTTEQAVAALDKAKSEIEDALGLPSLASIESKEEVKPPGNVITLPEMAPARTVAEAEPETVAEATGEDDGQLYVIEEKSIRGRPARILSDNTVEAETDEGWMRFENLEHLEEYLDAMAPAKA